MFMLTIGPGLAFTGAECLGQFRQRPVEAEPTEIKDKHFKQRIVKTFVKMWRLGRAVLSVAFSQYCTVLGNAPFFPLPHFLSKQPIFCIIYYLYVCTARIVNELEGIRRIKFISLHNHQIIGLEL